MRPQGLGSYSIVAGERRWRACRMAGLTEVPVVKDVSDEQAMELALVETSSVRIWTRWKAAGIRELMLRCDLTQEQAARKLGKSRSAGQTGLRLLNLPENVLELLKSGFLNMGHAKVILGLPTGAAGAGGADRGGQSMTCADRGAARSWQKPRRKQKNPNPAAPCSGKWKSLKQVLGSPG